MFGRKKFTESELCSIEQYIECLLTQGDELFEQLGEAKSFTENEEVYEKITTVHDRLEKLLNDTFRGHWVMQHDLKKVIKSVKDMTTALYMHNKVRFLKGNA